MGDGRKAAMRPLFLSFSRGCPAAGVRPEGHILLPRCLRGAVKAACPFSFKQLTAIYHQFFSGRGCLLRLVIVDFFSARAAYHGSLPPISLQRGPLLIVALYRQFLSNEGRCLLLLYIVNFSPTRAAAYYGLLSSISLRRQFFSGEGCLPRLFTANFSPVSISFQWGPFPNRPRRFMPHPARRDITAAIGKMRLDRLPPSSTRSSE